MKRILFVWAAVCAAAGALVAETVTPEMAQQMASAWVEGNAAFASGGAPTRVITVSDTNAAQTVLWHQVSLAGGGALMVAPVTEIEPVIAALEKDPGELPAAHPLRAMLAGDMRRRLTFLGLYGTTAATSSASGSAGTTAATSSASGSAGTTAATVSASRGSGTTASTGTVSRVSGAGTPVAPAADPAAAEWGAQQRAKWTRLLNQASARVAVQTGVADPIATQVGIVDGFEQGGRFTHWDQGDDANGRPCYNYYTPGNSVCGCVATAAAAILQFFSVPFVVPYTNPKCQYQGRPYAETFGADAATLQSEDDPKVYDWSQFDSCTTRADYDTLTDAQRETLGRLAFDAGVLVGMSWDEPGSNASGAPMAGFARMLRKGFQFSEARLVVSPRQSQYAKLIYAQVRAGAPVAMGIEGHAVVAVGYGRDGDNVERVRVFMGWGGFGDGWYALPYIDTTATAGGSSYLSEIIDSVVTFINRETDAVVPVVGQLLPTMAEEVVCGAASCRANTHGFFGMRLSAELSGEQVLTCRDRTLRLTLPGLPAADESYFISSAHTLCAAVPDEQVILLLHSETAATPDDAKALALASGKPMLFFSGVPTDPASAAAWQIIYDLDENNTDNFRDKFVIAYFSWDPAASHPSDGCPSYGIFDPARFNVDSDDRWAFYNGRLAWSDCATVVTNTSGGVTTYAATAETTNALFSVMNDGRRQFLIDRGGIEVSIVANPSNAIPEEVRAGEFVPGEAVTFTQPLFVTNETTGVVWQNLGWSFTATAANGTTETTSGATTSACVTPLTNAVNTLTWNWTNVKVRVTAAVQDFKGLVPGTLDCTEVWLAPDNTETNEFTFTPARNFAFSHWVLNGAEVENAGATLPVSVAPTPPEEVGGYTLVAVAKGLAEYKLTVEQAPALFDVSGVSSTPPLGVSYHMNGLVTATLSPGVVTNQASGLVWSSAWAFEDGVSSDAGTGPEASFAFTRAGTLTWSWGVDVAKTLALQNWAGDDPAAATRVLGRVTAGATAEDVRFFNLPAGWRVTPAVAADGTISVDLVATPGWAAAHGGFALNVKTTPSTIVPIGGEAPGYSVSATDATGAVTVVAPAAYTNETAGQVFKPVAWTTSGGASGTGVTATFTAAEGDDITLTWTWALEKVRLAATVAQYTQNGYQITSGTIEPAEVWVTNGAVVTFTYLPDHTPHQGIALTLDRWTCTADKARWSWTTNTATVTASDTAETLTAELGRAYEYYLLGIAGRDVASGTNVVCGTPEPGYTQVKSALMWNDPAKMTMADAALTNVVVVAAEESGAPTETTNVWACVGWQLEDTKGNVVASGTGTTAEYRQTANNCTFVWLWENTVLGAASGSEPDPEPTPVYAQPTAIAFTAIVPVGSNFQLQFTNAVKYCRYKLYSAATPDGLSTAATPDQEVTAEADGPLEFIATPAADGRFWKVVAEPGLVPSETP